MFADLCLSVVACFRFLLLVSICYCFRFCLRQILLVLDFCSCFHGIAFVFARLCLCFILLFARAGFAIRLFFARVCLFAFALFLIGIESENEI